MRDQWLGYLPSIDFSQAYPGPMLWDLPDFQKNLGASRNEEVVPYLPGVREAIFREAIILARKLLYCWSTARALATRGRQAWTAVAAYEASFFGAKSFCYLHGFASLGRDSKFYLNAFHETEFKRNKQRIIELDMQIYNLQSRLEHATLWSIMERLLNTTIFDAGLLNVQAALKEVDWDRYSGFRNRMMYVGAFWPMIEPFAQCDLTKDYCHPDILEALELVTDTSPPFSGEYYNTAKLIRRALYLMVADLASLAPALLAEAEALRPEPRT